jgi:hypothetical protein
MVQLPAISALIKGKYYPRLAIIDPLSGTLLKVENPPRKMPG